LGIAQGAYNDTVKYVKERKQFGSALSKFQNTQFRIADMHAQIESARLLVYRAAMAKETGKRFSVESATAKLFAGRPLCP
jgi:butyryl-CoA dehydrogenase